MAEYVVAPLEEPEWVLGADELVAALEGRWPGVRMARASVEQPTMALEAWVPLGAGEVVLALSGTGQAVSVEAAEVEAAAEFAQWLASSVLPGAGLHLIEAGSGRAVELRTGLSVGAILGALRDG